MGCGVGTFPEEANRDIPLDGVSIFMTGRTIDDGAAFKPSEYNGVVLSTQLPHKKIHWA